MISYGFKKALDLPFDEAVAAVVEKLKEHGFGVLTTIDIQEKLKEKLGVDFRKYKILGACNPPNAHKALQAEPDIGLMLPCNVIVYEDGAASVLAAIKPSTAMSMIDNPALKDTALEVEARLKAFFDAM
jgi:uncharacterized protein (DUF302 family)